MNLYEELLLANVYSKAPPSRVALVFCAQLIELIPIAIIKTKDIATIEIFFKVYTSAIGSITHY
jgi:hypothetical protein